MKNFISAISLFSIIISILGITSLLIQEWNIKSDRIEYLEKKIKALSYLEAVDGPTICVIDESIGARVACNCYQVKMGNKNITECLHRAQTETNPIINMAFKTKIIQ